MDFRRLAVAKRDAQKKYKIPASRTNKALTDALSSLKSAEATDLLNKAAPKDLKMYFHRLSRRDLQSLCKKSKIRANMTNKAMSDALNSCKSGNKSAQKKNLRKKSMSKACEKTKSTQEKKIVSPCVARMEIEGEEEPSKGWMEDDLCMLSDPFPETKGPNISSDVIFVILSLVPTEVILQMRTIGDWAHIISDPVFIRAHCSRPCPITSFFTYYKSLDYKLKGRPYHFFKPLQSSPKFPNMITELLSSGFQAASTSHGLVCFHRDKDGVIILANPATSHWALIPRPPSSPSPSTDVNDEYYYSPPLIIYDPTLSFHFKLTIATCYIGEFSLRFHIYSSETSSWTLSSLSPPDISMRCFRILGDLYGCKESRIGGGSVCYWGTSFNTLCGYEIATDSYWVTTLPWSAYQKIKEERCYWLARDGDIYCVVFYCKSNTVKVRRLDENKCWVLEGESSGEGVEKFSRYLLLPNLSYDGVRKALLITVSGEGLYALYLSSSRVEFLGEDHTALGQSKLPHVNTLASFHGGKRDTHALDALLAPSCEDR